MSIASEITRLQGVKADILTAIGNKGVTIPTGSALDDCPTLIASIAGGGGGGGFDFSDFRIKSKMGKLDPSTFNENDFTIELPNSYSNKDYFNFSSCKITGNSTNSFYSDVRSKGREIDFCSYREGFGSDDFSPKIYFNSRAVEINGGYIGQSVFCSQSLTSDYKQRGNGGNITSISTPEYVENNFDKLVFWGPSYSGGSASGKQTNLFVELQIISRDGTKMLYLKPALKLSTNESGVVDLISGNFWPLDVVLYDV